MMWFKKKESADAEAYANRLIEAERRIRLLEQGPSALVKVRTQKATDFNGEVSYRGEIVVGFETVWIGNAVTEADVRNRYGDYSTRAMTIEAEQWAAERARSHLTKALTWLLQDEYTRE